MKNFKVLLLLLSGLLLLTACAARPAPSGDIPANGAAQCYCECNPARGSYSYQIAPTANPTPPSNNTYPASSYPQPSDTAGLPPVVNSRYGATTRPAAGAVATAGVATLPKSSNGNYVSHSYRRPATDVQSPPTRTTRTSNVAEKQKVLKKLQPKKKAVQKDQKTSSGASKSKSDSNANKQPSGVADKPYKVLDTWYYPLATAKGYNQTGNASWYGKRFHGGPTASGEKFDMNALTAAHTTLPFNSKVKVTNLGTGASVVLRINDRGPFSEDRLIDVSAAAAERLGFNGQGSIKVRVEGLE